MFEDIDTDFIPEKRNDSTTLLDACIASYPQHFTGCPSLSRVERKLGYIERLDFDAGRPEIPRWLYTLRQEAVPLYQQLSIWVADLRPFQLQE